MPDWSTDAMAKAEGIAMAAEHLNLEAQVHVKAMSNLATRLIERTERLKAEAEDLKRILAELPAVPEESASTDTVPGGVRLLVTQMKAEGRSRDEVEARLREQFGIADVDAALAGGFSDARPEQ